MHRDDGVISNDVGAGAELGRLVRQIAAIIA
jgi:hypothetical protein